jgi:subtilase family serine protease
MKHMIILYVSLFAASALTSPLLAQEADAGKTRVHPIVQVVTTTGITGGAPTGILPVQYKVAYGFNRIANQGQGQTIAIVVADDAVNIESDLAVYASYFHLGPCSFQKIKVGNPTRNDGSALSASVGVEQVCALASQATILLVEANSDTLSDYLHAASVASSAPYNATIVAVIFATQEFSGEQQFDSTFCGVVNGNNQSVTFLAPTAGCSGRSGVYPAASPCVLAVGGTALTLSTFPPAFNSLVFNYGNETSWGSGGGAVSPFEPQPAWQNPACSQYSTTNRCTPDVVADSSTLTPVPVYDTAGYGGWVEVGGNSISTADVGAFLAIVNSVRASEGHGPLSQAAPDLYDIYGSGNYSANFHDVTSGSCSGTGYDLGTGIGSYKADTLYSTLAAKPN